MDIVPYTNGPDGWSIPDAEMFGVFMEMQRRALDTTVFIAGKVTDCGEFLEMCREPGTLVHLVKDGETLLAVAWVDSIGHNYAFAHYCMFPPAWGQRSIDVAAKCLAHWFFLQDPETCRPLFQVILGRTPVKNVRATRFLEKLGMTIVGVIPLIGKDIYADSGTADMLFSYMKREDFIHGR